MSNLIEISLYNGVYTVANLDGGTFTVLIVNNKIVNNPVNFSGKMKKDQFVLLFI